MKKTRLCDLVDIDYPIIQGGMMWVANAELAAAVSNAGALGLVISSAGMDRDGDHVSNLREQIKKVKSLTAKPFGVNLTLLDNPQVEELVALIIAEGIKVVVTSGGNPALYTGRFKEAGIKVLHVVASVRHAQSAEKRGVDAVIAEGYEAGGRNGLDELPTFVLIPQVTDAVNVPVIAAGGIADARGVVAALALGADGVQMGTRFLATYECVVHSDVKKAIVNASDTDAVITGRKITPTRILRNEVAARLLEMEAAGASVEELQAFLGTGRARAGLLEGDLAEGQAYCGAIAGMIKQLNSADEVVRSIVDEYGAVIARLG